jgi:hypothetical protein
VPWDIGEVERGVFDVEWGSDEVEWGSDEVGWGTFDVPSPPSPLPPALTPARERGAAAQATTPSFFCFWEGVPPLPPPIPGDFWDGGKVFPLLQKTFWGGVWAARQTSPRRANCGSVRAARRAGR